jgi:hypothetical protein
MDAQEQLFAMMAIAEEQQAAVKTALDGLAAERAAIAEERKWMGQVMLAVGKAVEGLKTGAGEAVAAALQEHACGFKNLSDAGVSTTRKAIERQTEQLDELHGLTLQRISWMMLWPVVSTLVLCLAMLGGAALYSSWKVSQAEDEVLSKQAQIQKLEAQFCNSPAGKKICTKAQ